MTGGRKAARAKANRQARKPASLPKSDGNTGVRAYIASMEPWQAAIARRVHALVVKQVLNAPPVREAMAALFGSGELYVADRQEGFCAARFLASAS